MQNPDHNENAVLACLFFIFLAILLTGIFTIRYIITAL